MYTLAKDENEPLFEWLAENLFFLQCWAQDSSQEAMLRHLRKMKENSLVRKDTSDYFAALTNEIAILCNFGNTNEAFSIAQRTLEEAKKTQDISSMIMSNYIMSNVYGSRSDFHLAYEYALQAMNIIQKHRAGNEERIPDISMLITVYSLDAHKWDDAAQWADSIIKYEPAYRDAYYFKAKAMYQKGNMPQFWKNYELGENMSNGSVTQPDILPYCRSVSQALRGNHDLAEKIAKDSVTSKMAVYELMTEIYKIRGDYKNAFTTYFEFIEHRDSLKAQKNISEITELMAQLNHSKEVQKAEQERHQERTFYITCIIFLLCLTIVIGVYTIYRKNQANNRLQFLIQQLDKQRKKTQKANDQLEMATTYKEHIIRELTQQIRANLNVIKGYAQLLENDFPHIAESERRNAFKHINAGYENLETFVSKLREAISWNDIKEEPLISAYKANDIARQAIKEEWARPWEECPVDFSTELHENRMVNTDYYRVKAIIRRAIHYIYMLGSVGRIQLKCHVDAEHDEILYTISQNQQHLPQNVASVLFDRYFTYGNKQHEGLYATRKLAATVNARIWYEPLENGGECLKVSVPLQSNDAPNS